MPDPTPQQTTTPPRRGGRPPGRLIVALAALALAAALAGGLAIASLGDDPAATVISVDAPVLTAPETAGRGADGRPVQLPSGRPTMVTFLFTECPDVCPLVAAQIATALDRAGPAADGLDVVAISVDPSNDTPAAVREFLARHDLQGRMRWMIGSRADLEPVWDAWGVVAQPAGDAGAGHDAEHHQPQSIHSAPVIFIDPAGRQVARYAAGVPYTPADLEREIRTLTG